MQTIVDRPGYFGAKRPHKIEFYNNLFGETKWSECWSYNGKILCFAKAVHHYDESYFLHLKANPSLVEFITSFGECYDNDRSNVQCGIEHDCQASPRHIQDISVRRALKRLGVWFLGKADNLLEIRGVGTNGEMLNPGKIPFYQPDMILDIQHGGPIPKWAGSHSVEGFWQRNKIIVVES